MRGARIPSIRSMMLPCVSRRHLAVGIGCKRGVSADAIEAAVLRALHALGALQAPELTFAHIAVVASIDIKHDEAGLRVFCERHALPLRLYRADELAHMPAEGVCEPSALLASEGGELVVPKMIDGHVTVAIATKKA